MKICCIFNLAPLYREGIFRLMDDDPELEVDFAFGEESQGGIALLDATKLNGFRSYLHNIYRKSGKLVWQRRSIRLAFSRKYDAYILTGNPGIRSNWIITLCARLLGRKVYLWTHGLQGSESRSTLRKNMAYFRRASHLLLYSEGARERLLQKGYPAERMTVIYNSLDYDKQLAIRSQIGDGGFIRNYFGNDLPLLMFVGRLTWVKQLGLLLEAIRPLDCNLVLVGDGPMRAELEQKTEAYGLTDRVWFYGETYDDHVIGTLLYHSAACVSPGNIGLTAMHALTFGTPVVTHSNPASQMPEAEAILPGTTGSLFEEGNTLSLSEAIRPWLTLTTSERQRIRENCYAVIDQKYNPRNQLNILHKLLLE